MRRRELPTLDGSRRPEAGWDLGRQPTRIIRRAVPRRPTPFRFVPALDAQSGDT